MMRRIFAFLIKFYQAAISPTLPFNHCRFYPSCSQYAIEAIEKHGILKGVRLASRRVLHCHPLSSKSGFDPVP